MTKLAEVKEVLTGYCSDYFYALEIAEVDSERLSREYGGLPYAYNITLVGCIVQDYFNIVNNGKWKTQIFLFSDEEEKAKFMKENASCFNIPSSN